MADRKISDLTALTTPASGDFLPIVDISEAAAASKNKRITIEELFRGVPLGTAAAPGIAIEGDEDTGVFSPGADQVAISTNGTGRLFVDSSGRVGLGTSSPDASMGPGLHIASASGNSIILQKESGAAIQFRSDASTIRATLTGLNAADGLGFNVGAAQTERMRLDSSGRLGLGTSSPSSLLHLADAGNISVGTTTGTKIGTATTQKLGFYNATPVVQPAAVADATDAATVITQLNDLLAKLRTLGLIAT